MKHKEAIVEVERLSSGKNRITVQTLGEELFISQSTWETAYSLDLVKTILELKGPAWLCDEIMRDESPDYVQKGLTYDLLGYVNENGFKNRRILDFGCGGGASTMILGRMFPHAEIVGIELEEKLVSIAKLRKEHYGFDDRIRLLVSPDAISLPKGIGRFDYVIMRGVYEHLLPFERKMLLPQIWDLLKPEGILFLNETPHRYWPVENHTTSGLPIINYLPDKAAFFIARKFSKRKLQDHTWESLLRQGIRGGSVREILSILTQSKCKQKPILLAPSRLGAKDRIDLWYIKSGKARFLIGRKIVIFLLNKFLKMTAGFIFLPGLSLAVKKSPENW